jgi:hypothetical protein
MNGEAYDDAMDFEGYADFDESDIGTSEMDEMLDGPYRAPVAPGGAVDQKQLHDALARVAADVKRNGEGIKTLNTRLGGLTTRVDDVVSVNQIQSRAIGKLDKQMKIDGALDLAESFTPGGISAFQLLRGAVKSGLLGEGKGALGNPLVIGGIGLVLNNPGILGGLLPRPNP